VILGFARLIRWCLEVAERTDTQVNATLVKKAAPDIIYIDYSPRDFIESMINNYLFPDLSEPSDTEIIIPRIPIMHEETREELYHILVLLCKQVDNYAKVVDLMSDLIPHGMPSITTSAPPNRCVNSANKESP
jgi:ubiquitin carboxyl-terminal hydrolase 34